MFNKHRRKFRKRLENQVIRLRLVVIENSIFFNLLNNYQYHNFCYKLILHALPKRLLKTAWDVTEGYLLEDTIPSRV